jgi:hypothetical protein
LLSAFFTWRSSRADESFTLLSAPDPLFKKVYEISFEGLDPKELFSDL